MNRKQIALVILLAAGSWAVGTAAQAQTSVAAGIHVGPSGRTAVDIGFFSGDLAPYGRWVDRPAYGEVFVPRIRHAHWRPYTLGHWVWTDYGWTWVSDEPFGWATYHYGRWASDADLGWYWVPGTDWGPAWVSWQEGGDYIGWAALPPAVGFDVGLQLGGVDLGVAISPDSWCFVPERRFLDPRVGGFIVPQVRNAAIFPTTRNFTNISVVGNRIVNQGVPVSRVQQVIGRPVPRLQVADLAASSRLRTRVQGNQVAFFRPAVNSPHGAHHIGMAAADVAAARNGRMSANAAGRISSRQARQTMAARPSRMQQQQARNQQLGRNQQLTRSRQLTRNQQLQARRQGARVRQQQARIQQRQARVQQRQARVQQRQHRPQTRVQRRPPAAPPQVDNQRQNRQMRGQPQSQARVQQQPRQARAPQPQARVQPQRSQPPRQQAQARPRQANPRQGNPRPNNDHRRPPDQGPSN